MTDFISWGEFLKLIVGPGVNTAVGFLLSIAVEYWPKYSEWAPKWKRLVFIALSFVVPLGGTALAIATGEFGVWSDWATTWWPAIVAGATAAFAGTVAHIRKL